MNPQVLVVGAGPVGLTLAGELRLQGVDVTVIEQRSEPCAESRASTLHARTMELLHLRGLHEEFGRPPREMIGHFGGLPLDLTLDSPFAGQWKVPQSKTVAVLRNWATDLGAAVLDGHRLVGLDDTDTGVRVQVESPTAPVEIRAEYVVGCDGEDSSTARLKNFSFAGRPSDRLLHRADISGVELRSRRFERLQHGLAISARRGDVTRVMVHEFGSTAEQSVRQTTFAEVAAAWSAVTGENISLAQPHWVNSFGNASQQAVEYRRGRVFLAGDAAHRQMPVGGQALNLGIQDAFNLGWKLATHLTGPGDLSLIESYHVERHAVGARVLAGIESQASLLLGGPDVEPLRTTFTSLIENDGFRRQLASTIAGLDIDYRKPGGIDPDLPSGSRVHPDLIDADRIAAATLQRGCAALMEVAVTAPADDAPSRARRMWTAVRPDGYRQFTTFDAPPQQFAPGNWFDFALLANELQRTETT